jgi:hypothetical protein
MRALVASLAVIAAGTIWFYVMGPLVWAAPRFTVYQAAFAGTLTVALVAAVKARDPAHIRVALILVAGWIAHQFVHAGQTYPLALHGAINVAVATAIVMPARERWEALVALSYLAIVAFGAMTHFGYVPGIAARPRGAFIAWSYPDIAAVIGHFANMVVGVSTDAGHRRPAGSMAWLRGRFRPSLAAVYHRWRS